jgi:mono/diheme cytochrome c family protein
MWIIEASRRLPGRAAPAIVVAALTGILPALTGCRQDMHDQPKYEALEASDFFADGLASRPAVAGTVPWRGYQEDRLLTTGKTAGKFSTEFPFPVTMDLLRRGQDRYEIYCSPCHDRLGDGQGMVVRRGFSAAASFHIDRLRKAEPGYYFDVITNGFGRMPGYSAQIASRDRWAIVAYVRALQRSRQGTIDDVPADRRSDLLSERRGR